ncbi:MAG: hypothetical protein SOU54_00180 [Prevotella sp.]|nr:hypothetical protein [Prevotella sp.]MCI7426676.1 hypothetical protein [Prevotella sp.]MDY2771220.1 hypothetical protein [Prevotella sp.]MDY2893350.1 hypothetical protein [Prevotella sp.]MDY5369061.1 hypothetical protein [Prevotella sp.]
MKKTLLSLAAMLLLAGGASAQTAKSATVYTDKVDATPVSVVKKAKAPMMKEEESKYALLGFTGSDNPSQMYGFPTWQSASMVMSELDNGVDYDFSELAGYKLVGLNFAVTANLGEQAGAFAIVYQDENDQEGTELDSPYLVEGTDYTVSTVEDQRLTLQWNSVAFAEPYEITGDETAFLYGLAYEQVKGNGTTQEEIPFLMGVSTDSGVEGMFLVYGQPSSEYQEGLYTLNDPNDKKSDKYCLCMQLILETPGGSTVILGLNGSDKPVAMQYYSLDGKKLSAPQKGINVVKMSDGTSKKVLVK